MDTTVETKLPVTMRLPRREVEIVADYARSSGITKTDAFLHYLRLGIQSEKDSSARLGEMEKMLAEVLRRLPEESTFRANSVSSAIADECRNFSAIKRAILFGSLARGDATAESDVDVRLEVDRKEKFSLYDVARLQKAIERRTGREVDIVTADRIKNGNLARAIEREGVVVYEREG